MDYVYRARYMFCVCAFWQRAVDTKFYYRMQCTCVIRNDFIRFTSYSVIICVQHVSVVVVVFIFFFSFSCASRFLVLWWWPIQLIFKLKAKSVDTSHFYSCPLRHAIHQPPPGCCVHNRPALRKVTRVEFDGKTHHLCARIFPSLSFMIIANIW